MSLLENPSPMGFHSSPKSLWGFLQACREANFCRQKQKCIKEFLPELRGGPSARASGRVWAREGWITLTAITSLQSTSCWQSQLALAGCGTGVQHSLDGGNMVLSNLFLPSSICRLLQSGHEFSCNKDIGLGNVQGPFHY